MAVYPFCFTVIVVTEIFRLTRNVPPIIKRSRILLYNLPSTADEHLGEGAKVFCRYDEQRIGLPCGDDVLKCCFHDVLLPYSCYCYGSVYSVGGCGELAITLKAENTAWSTNIGCSACIESSLVANLQFVDLTAYGFTFFFHFCLLYNRIITNFMVQR